MAAAPGEVRGLDELGWRSPLAASTKWVRVTTNLSGKSNLHSVYPDVAVSSDGQYVAVVWQEQAAGDSKLQGHIYIRCAQEDTPGWGAKRSVPGSYHSVGGRQRRGQMPAVALHGNQVHVVWSGGFEEDPDDTYDKIYYQVGTIGTDNLVTGWDANSVQTVASVPGATLGPLDIDVDDSGQPHVVWQRENADNTRHIYYNTLDGGAWGTPEKVSRNADTRNQYPAVAVEGTTAHVTWVGGTISGTVSIAGGDVYYAHSDDDWAAPEGVTSLSPSYWEPQHPSIAVMDNQVGIAWETWKDFGDADKVDANDLWSVYYATKNGGWSEEKFGDDFYPHYLKSDGTEYDEYVRSVRPCLAYASNPLTPTEPTPHIALARTRTNGLLGTMRTAWYVRDDGGWAWETIPLGGSGGGERGAARMAIGHYGGEDHVHFVYQAVVRTEAEDPYTNWWDVFYTSDEIYNSVYYPTVFLNHP